MTSPTDHGRSPLHWAARGGALAQINELIATGADVNHRDDYGTTPLMWAAQTERVPIIQALIDAGGILDHVSSLPEGMVP